MDAASENNQKRWSRPNTVPSLLTMASRVSASVTSSPRQAITRAGPPAVSELALSTKEHPGH